MLWAEDMWTPVSHLLVRSQCWVGTGCKLCPCLASLLLFGVREKQEGEDEVFISAACEKGPLSTLNVCKQSTATFAKAEEEMSTACAVYWEFRSVPGIQWGWSPGWSALLEAGQEAELQAREMGSEVAGSGKDREKRWWWEGELQFLL